LEAIFTEINSIIAWEEPLLKKKKKEESLLMPNRQRAGYTYFICARTLFGGGAICQNLKLLNER